MYHEDEEEVGEDFRMSENNDGSDEPLAGEPEMPDLDDDPEDGYH